MEEKETLKKGGLGRLARANKETCRGKKIALKEQRSTTETEKFPGDFRAEWEEALSRRSGPEHKSWRRKKLAVAAPDVWGRRHQHNEGEGDQPIGRL